MYVYLRLSVSQSDVSRLPRFRPVSLSLCAHIQLVYIYICICMYTDTNVDISLNVSLTMNHVVDVMQGYKDTQKPPGETGW